MADNVVPLPPPRPGLTQQVLQGRSPMAGLAARPVTTRGGSYLTVLVPEAAPRPPDIAAGPEVPTGVLLPCTPIHEIAGTPTPITANNGKEYLLQFPFGQGVRLLLKRIHIKVPVVLLELGAPAVEVTTINNTIKNTFAAEAEAIKAIENTPSEIVNTETTPFTPTEPAVQRINKTTRSRAGAVVTITEERKTERSLIPTTVQLIAQIKGPEGELWSGAFNVPITWRSGTRGLAAGMGTLDSYADLQNAIIVDKGVSAPIYTVALFLLIPGKGTKVAAVVGREIVSPSEEILPGNGGVTIFYEIEPAPVSK